MSDKVNHPKHYNEHPSGIECIQITEHMNFCLGNAIKYIWRAGSKDNAIEDLKKAVWYLQREIQLIEKSKNNTDSEKTLNEWEAEEIIVDEHLDLPEDVQALLENNSTKWVKSKLKMEKQTKEHQKNNPRMWRKNAYTPKDPMSWYPLCTLSREQVEAALKGVDFRLLDNKKIVFCEIKLLCDDTFKLDYNEMVTKFVYATLYGLDKVELKLGNSELVTTYKRHLVQHMTNGHYIITFVQEHKDPNKVKYAHTWSLDRIELSAYEKFFMGVDVPPKDRSR